MKRVQESTKLWKWRHLFRHVLLFRYNFDITLLDSFDVFDVIYTSGFATTHLVVSVRHPTTY